MLKGVTKQIIEVNRTGNEYIEKAIFVINPCMASEDMSKVHKNISEFLTLSDNFKGIYNKKYKRAAVWLSVLSAVLFILLLLSIFI